MEHFQHQVDLDTVMPGYPPGLINPPEGNRYLRRLDEGLLYDAANPRAFIVCGNNY